MFLDSDRSAYVLGEQWRGVAKGSRNVVFVAVGTGIGAGILYDGRVVHGAGDVAGAVGWFALNPHFRAEYASHADVSRARPRGTRWPKEGRPRPRGGRPTMMRERAGKAVTRSGRDRVPRGRGGDVLAEETLDAAETYMGMGIANIVNILNPEIVVLGGGLFQPGRSAARACAARGWRAGLSRWPPGR